ncbi:MAG: hypothetical protein Tsb0014_20380 [Pleurocapsa sp.]
MKQNSIKERIFLVGCPRSGTTFLQSMVATHSQIYSFPESKFFQHLINPNSRRSKLLMLPTKRAKSMLFRFLNDINYHKKEEIFKKNLIFTPQYVRCFVKILDELTLDNGNDCWLEKTPSHIRRINCIEKFVPQAKFIHIVRDGIEVVASLYEVTNNYPEIWGRPLTIDQCLNRWLNDVSITQHHIHKPNHLLIKYENLVADTKLELQKICKFVDISFESKMLSNFADTAPSLYINRLTWKSEVNQTIQTKKSQKFNQLFDKKQREYIRDRVSTIDLEKPTTLLSANPMTDCDVRG